MEGRQRRSFPDDYKRQAVDLVASSGRSWAQFQHWPIDISGLARYRSRSICHDTIDGQVSQLAASLGFPASIITVYSPDHTLAS